MSIVIFCTECPKTIKANNFWIQLVLVFCKLIYIWLKLAWLGPTKVTVEIFTVECRGLSSTGINDETIIRI